jgi:GrpB-like predicted nucleotidyltransferase (UPF0157 family)
MPNRVVLVESNPAWPVAYAEVEALLRLALGPVAVRIEHVGSTAVPGLAAKPVIDVQVSVVSFDPLDPYRVPLERIGFVYRADDEPEHRFFGLTDSDGIRRVNLHVCESGSDWERRHVAFRDALRADSDLRARYEAEKRRVAALHPDDSLAYAEAKTPWIRAEERRLRIVDAGAGTSGGGGPS